MFNKIYVAGIKRKNGVPDDEMLTQVVHVHTQHLLNVRQDELH
jgi:hypothetical protein